MQRGYALHGQECNAGLFGLSKRQKVFSVAPLDPAMPNLWLLLCCALWGAALGTRPIVDFGPDFVPSQQANMNGDYVFSPTPNGTPGMYLEP